MGDGTPVVNSNGTKVGLTSPQVPAPVSLGANPDAGGYDREAIERFVRTLCADAPGLVQTVRSDNGELYPRFHTTDERGISEAVSRLENLSRACAEKNHLYIQVSTCVQNPNTDDQPDFGIFGRKRGGKDNVSHLLCLWTDIDYGDDGHAEAKNGRLPNPPDAATAQAVYEKTGLPEASVLINSGGGLYQIILLESPLDLRDPAVRARVESVSKRWQQLIEKTAREMGYHYGVGVSNLDRILRVPGTVNTKIWDNKRRATAVYSEDEARYCFADLEAMINELHPEPPVPKRPDGGRIGVERFKGSGGDHLPGTDFNNRGDWQRDIIDPAGITYAHAAGNVTYWCRPGKTPRDGHSFSLNHKPDLLFAFTDGTALTQWKYFDKFSAFTHLFHGGDFKAAATELRSMGYGEALAPTPTHTAPASAPPPVREPEKAPGPAPQTETAPPPPTTTATPDDDDGGDEPGDALTDTRLPAIVGKFRASSDKKPFTVATQLKDTFFLHGGKPTLMRWQDIWVRWNGACWGTMSDADVTSWLYQRMDAAYMTKKVDGEWAEEPWNPANSSINNLDKALRAAVNLRDDTKQNTMVGEGVHDLAISCTNGLLRVTGRELAPADPAYFTFSSVPFGYDRNADCPEWVAWLKETFEHDPDSIAMIQEWFGYVLSGRTDLQKALMLQGPERSGKGTIARILQMLAGWSNCAGPTLNSLTEQFGMWALTDKTLAVIGDARLPKRGTEVITERLLSIIGEDTIQVDRKYQRPWEGKIPARLVLLTNEIPNWADSAGVLPTRWIVATTAVSHLGREDTTLIGRLAAELPGILNWALDGLDRLIEKNRFTVNQATPEIVGAQRDRSAPQKGFISEVCVLGDDKWVSKERLREMWVLWNQGHSRQVSDTRESFTTKLIGMVPTIKAKDQKKRIDGKLVPVFRGIGLIIDDPEAMAARDREERATEAEEKQPEPTGQQTLPDPEPPATPDESVPPPRNGRTPTRHEDAVRSSVNSLLRTLTLTINPIMHRTERDRQ